MSLTGCQNTPAIEDAFYRPNGTSYQLQSSFHTHSTEPEPTAGAATPPGPARAAPEFAVPRRLLRRGPRIGGGRGRGGGAGIARSRGRGGARGRPRARELRYDAGRHRRRRRLATLAPLGRWGRGGAPQPPVAANAEGRVRRLLGAAPRGGLLPLHVRRGVPEISADTSLDTSIARRHAIAAVVSMSDPRRHVCLCAACAGAADACPMCRRPVEDVFRVFLS
mmetsp:Transcript_1984/g.6511  ORF Transcript_1984/g.6511 Transcript_1984/m.6511 type:complete len:222 (-) Transcript_1984:82-747(-)